MSTIDAKVSAMNALFTRGQVYEARLIRPVLELLMPSYIRKTGLESIADAQMKQEQDSPFLERIPEVSDQEFHLDIRFQNGLVGFHYVLGKGYIYCPVKK